MGKIWQFPRNEAGKVLGWSDDSSPSNPNAALALVNRSLSEGPVDFRTYATLAEAAGSNIPPVIDEVEILNFATVGDGGGARYKRVETEPTHEGKFQSANGAWWELANQTVKPAMFGAIGDGVADDTTAITNAMTIERTLDWGDVQKVYRTTAQITITPTRELDWTAKGATIQLDSGAAVAEMIRVNFPPGTHKINGVLKLDGQQLAYTGFAGRVATPSSDIDECPNFIATDLQVSNIRRSGTTYGGGDGIAIAGGFNRIELVRPNVVDVAVAPGASIIGSVGVTGITIGRDSTNGLSARNVVIQDPYVDRIYSEDPTVRYDQDGIRIFQYYDGVSDDPQEASAVIRGGLIKNSRNRSIKMQTQFGRIEGVKLEKDSSIDIGSHGVTQNSEIEFQVGGGFINDLEILYDGFVPDELIRYTESVSATKKVAGMFVSGVRGTVTGGSTMPTLFQAQHSSGVGAYVAHFERVHIIGPIGELLVCGTVVAAGTARAMLRDVWATVTSHGVVLNGGGALRVTMDGVHNLGSAVPLISNPGGQTDQHVSAPGCTGFTAYNNISETQMIAGVERIAGFTVHDMSAPGTWRVHSFTLAQDQQVTIPFQNGAAGSHGLMFVGVSGTTQSQGVFSFSSAEVLKLTSEGSQFTVGTTSDPGSGIIRLWGSSSGPVIKNGGVTTRTVSVMTMG